MMVIIPLMAYRENCNCVVIVDLEQGYVASSAEWDNEFAEKRVGFLGSSTGKRKLFKQ